MIAGLGTRLYAWLAAVLTALAAIVGIYLSGRRAGTKAEHAKAIERELADQRALAETVREASDAQIEVGRLPADDVHQRLRDKWTRTRD